MGQLVYFVDIDDTPLGHLHIALRRIQQARDDRLHIVPYIAGLGQGGGIGDHQRHADDLRQGAGQQGLAGTGGPQQQDVRFVDAHLAVFGPDVGLIADGNQALVVIVNRHRQGLFGAVLADDEFIQLGLHLHRRQRVLEGGGDRPLAPPTAHHLAGQLDTGFANVALLADDQGGIYRIRDATK